ncbi:MAG: hypothetical protein K2I19_02855 [Muribaculaceae bacterium]|nr:hypothetical protein [Muribaculaceae bacterium]
MIINLPEEITAPGKYTMTIPEAFFAFDWWERDCSALTYSWTIEQAGVSDIIGVESAEAEYYSLQGVRIDSPRPGEVVIRRIGGKAEKIIVR